MTITVHLADDAPFDIEIPDDVSESLEAYVQAVYSGDWNAWFTAVIAGFLHDHEPRP